MFLHAIATPLRKNIPLVAVTSLLLFSLLACGFRKQTIFLNSDFSSDEISSQEIGIIDEDDILSAIAQIDLITPDRYYPAKTALIIKRPSYLRLELIPVIGVSDFFMTATPEKIKVFIPSKGEFYSGRPTGSNLKKFLPWPIEIEDMIMIFTGTYPSFKEKDITYQKYQEKNLLCLEMKSPSGCSQILWREADDKLVKFVRKDEKGHEVYTVKYIYNEDVSAFPEKIIIIMADGVTSLSVKYVDVKIEKAMDLSVFDLVIPDDVKEIILD